MITWLDSWFSLHSGTAQWVSLVRICQWQLKGAPFNCFGAADFDGGDDDYFDDDGEGFNDDDDGFEDDNAGFNDDNGGFYDDDDGFDDEDDGFGYDDVDGDNDKDEDEDDGAISCPGGYVGHALGNQAILWTLFANLCQ